MYNSCPLFKPQPHVRIWNWTCGAVTGPLCFSLPISLFSVATENIPPSPALVCLTDGLELGGQAHLPRLPAAHRQGLQGEQATHE